jgi:hypothetical protein
VTFKDRLHLLERERQFRIWRQACKFFAGYSPSEMYFFSIYGYFLEGHEANPGQLQFQFERYRITVVVERLDETQGVDATPLDVTKTV